MGLPASVILHLLRRVDSQEVQARAEYRLGRGTEGEAAGSHVRVFDQDAVYGIELVEARGEGFQVGRDRVYLTPGGRILYDPGEVEEFEHEQAFFWREIPMWNLARLLRFGTGPLEDARDPGVGVLYVEDGVLFGLPDREIEVEVHLRLVGGSHVEVARHVLPHLVEQLIQGHYVAGPFAELDLFAFPHELHEP